MENCGNVSANYGAAHLSPFIITKLFIFFSAATPNTLPFTDNVAYFFAPLFMRLRLLGGASVYLLVVFLTI